MYKSSLNKQRALLVIVQGKNENKIILLLITVLESLYYALRNFLFFFLAIKLSVNLKAILKLS